MKQFHFEEGWISLSRFFLPHDHFDVLLCICILWQVTDCVIKRFDCIHDTTVFRVADEQMCWNYFSFLQPSWWKTLIWVHLKSSVLRRFLPIQISIKRFYGLHTTKQTPPLPPQQSSIQVIWGMKTGPSAAREEWQLVWSVNMTNDRRNISNSNIGKIITHKKLTKINVKMTNIM